MRSSSSSRTRPRDKRPQFARNSQNVEAVDTHCVTCLPASDYTHTHTRARARVRARNVRMTFRHAIFSALLEEMNDG